MLRPYQIDAIDAVRSCLETSDSVVLQMPTGAGKTKTATEIVRTTKGVVWFVCHRQEIERQVSAAFTAAGIDHGVVSPRSKPDFSKRVQVVSVASLRRKMADLPQPSLVFWDECHHVAAKSWASIREHLYNAKHIGLTATPERLDGKGLKEWFDYLVVGPSITTLIEQGYLSPYRYFAPSDPDLTNAKLQAGDYKKGDLEAVMNTPVLIGDAIAEYRDKLDGKRAIVFCSSVEASQTLVGRFKDEGVPAAHVDGSTRPEDRQRAIDAFSAGDIKVLSNVEVFTEGFDLPAIDGVILLRPTKSVTLLLQMIGRALRVTEGKEEAIILDHAGLYRDHGLFANSWQWSLDGGAAKARRAALERGPRKCPECNEVRADRVEVCACGYEFPTGREIGEFDGKLRELVGFIPPGCETKEAFSRRWGTSSDVVNRWIARGLPTRGPYVPVSEAIGWVEENWHPKEIPPRNVTTPHEARHTFMRRFGLSAGAMKKAEAQGFNHFAKNGWVDVEAGSRWMEENWLSKNTPPIGCSRETHDSVNSFATRIGRDRGVVYRMIKDGMPASQNNWIPFEDALQWIAEKNALNTNQRHPKEYPIGTCESQNAFRKRLGVTRFAVGGDKRNSSGWVGEGLPLASNGWVHIQKGLEWVRDNTDVQIPTEAWPSANDNEQQKDAA